MMKLDHKVATKFHTCKKKKKKKRQIFRFELLEELSGKTREDAMNLERLQKERQQVFRELA